MSSARLLSIHKASMSRGSCCRIAQLDVSSRHVPPLHSAFALRSTRWRVGPGCPLGRAARWAGLLAGPGCPLGRAAPWAGLPPGPGCLACPWAAAHPHNNFARNSPVITSNIEFVPLELQRFRVVSKNDRGKLRAKFVWVFLLPSTGTAAGPRYPLAPQPGPPGPPTSSTRVGPGR